MGAGEELVRGLPALAGYTEYSIEWGRGEGCQNFFDQNVNFHRKFSFCFKFSGVF